MLSPRPEQKEAPATHPDIAFPRGRTTGAVLTALLAVAVVILTCLVAGHSGPVGPDADWLHWFIGHRGDTLTTFAKGISALGDITTTAAYALLACMFLAWRRFWEHAVLVAITTAGAFATIFFGKLLIARDRPPVIYHLVTETNHSYPSGHALGSTAVIGVLVTVVLPALRRAARYALIAVAVLFVAAVGVSRLYLGVHWTTDVLAGWLFGTCWLSLCLSLRPWLPLARSPLRLT